MVERKMKPTKKMIEASAKARWYFHQEKEGSWDEELQEVRDFELEASKVALKAAEAVRPSGWQPIETAPKDGTEVIITNGVDTCTGKYHKSVVKNFYPFFAQSVNGELRNEGFDYKVEPVYFYEPTHWMPLPEPPTTD